VSAANVIAAVEVVEIWADRVVLRTIMRDEHGDPHVSEWSLTPGATLNVYSRGFANRAGERHEVYGIMQTFGEGKEIGG
jgi:hypothetical protein